MSGPKEISLSLRNCYLHLFIQIRGHIQRIIATIRNTALMWYLFYIYEPFIVTCVE